MFKFKTYILGLAAVLIASLLLTACQQSPERTKATAGGQAAAPSAASSSEQSAVQSVQNAASKRVVTLNHSLPDFLIALGITPAATVVYNNQFYPFLAEKMKGVTPLGLDNAANLEAILDSKPTLIIGVQESDQKIKDSLVKIAPTELLSEPFDNWRTTLQTIAKLTGTEKEAERALNQYDEKAKTAKQRIAARVKDETVVFLRITQKGTRLYGSNLRVGSVLYNDLGLKPAKSVPKDEEFVNISLEVLPDINPDHIFLLDTESKDATKEIKESAIWKSLNAVKNNHVYPVDQTLWVNGKGPLTYQLVIDDVVKALAP